MKARYTQAEILKLLRKVPKNDEGRMNFTELQKTVLGSQLRRMKAIVARVEGGKPVCPPKEAPIKVGYQSQAAAHLMAITKKKKYHNEQEAIVADQKRMH